MISNDNTVYNEMRLPSNQFMFLMQLKSMAQLELDWTMAAAFNATIDKYPFQ